MDADAECTGVVSSPADVTLNSNGARSPEQGEMVMNGTIGATWLLGGVYVEGKRREP